MKVGTHITLRLTTKDQRLLAELMAFWKRTDKEIMRLALDQLVLATQQVQQRLMDEETKNEGNNDTNSHPASSTGYYQDLGVVGDGTGEDGQRISQSVADGTVSNDGPADGSDASAKQLGSE